ncbi:MAG: lytic transglycosylase [Hirschia sp.]|nr:lytic transglycosylase [Hirschia sp.]MBF18074.1 lytic transglycosylase [Hirschia sp.]
MKRFLIITSVFYGVLISPALATPQAPSVKPRVQYVSNVISQDDYADLESGLEAADTGAWSVVRRNRARITDPDARNLLLWSLVTESSASATFSELNAGLDILQDWPRYNVIRRDAEALIGGSTLSDSERLQWFERQPPLTGDGKLELARLLRNSGKATQADAMIRDVWRTHSLSLSSAADVLRNHSNILTQEDHAIRVELLLWSGQRSEARRLMPRLSNAERLTVDAQLSLMERRRGVDDAISAVPASHQSDPGLLLERAKWRRQRLRNMDGAIELLLQIDSADAIPSGRDNIWSERRIALRTLIKERRWKEAYAICANHNMNEGESFAEAEFYAGWVALRYLNDAATAYKHFDNLAANVGTPISLGRGHYWRGRALAALGRKDEAMDAYAESSRQIFTFYGQLAAEELEKGGKGNAILSFDDIPAPTNDEMAAFLAKPVIRAARLLAETGRLRDFERFSYHIDDQLETPQQHQILFDLAMSYLEPRAGVRNGKAGLSNGIVTPNAAYPVITLPRSGRSGAAEEALVIALSRQESELEPTAVSHANARGMMQLLPATGRQTARTIGEPYRTSWLTDDPTYNLTLGRSFLDGLVDRFDGSYIMALAAYNAGPSRPVQWIEDYGDPRTGEIDPIDWIESIPFSETRNYVQRIMENLQVYRHRLTGEPTEIRLSADIRRGSLRR